MCIKKKKYDGKIMIFTLGSDVAKGLMCAMTNGKSVVTNVALPRTSVATTSSALSLANAKISFDL